MFRTFYGQDPRCDLTIEIAGSDHDIGLKKQADGTYVPVFDPYGGGVARNLGAQAQFCEAGDNTGRYIGKLLQVYGVCKAEREAASNGYMTTREYDKQTGTMQLVVSGY